MNDMLYNIPKMKNGNELKDAIACLPEYDENIRYADVNTRLISLSDLYSIYIPSTMSIEIYNKLYLALIQSMQKKFTQLSVKQRYENNKMIQKQMANGILGGSDSFTIIGKSGIGKSSAINHAVSLITENKLIEINYPYTKIIPCLTVQCPFDSSVKGLLLEILRMVDTILESDYYTTVRTSRSATVDMLIGMVSTIALNHIGLLIVDEIQNVVNSKNGKNLIGALTQLINNSGISICMVGTPECTKFFEQAMQLARRSIGLKYTNMQYDDYFRYFCKIIFSYQYVKNKTNIDESIIEWLYNHTSGVTSVVISLIHDAQEISILNGSEILNLETLNEAYNTRLSMMHDYIKTQPSPQKKIRKNSGRNSCKDIYNSYNSYNYTKSDNDNDTKPLFDEIRTISKKQNTNAINIIKNYYTVEEVDI